MRRLGFSAPLFVAFVAGCASSPTLPVQMLPPPLSTSSELCRDSALEDDDFCLPVERVEVLLSTPAWGVLFVKVTESGFSRPNVITLGVTDEATGDQVVIKTKWKIAPKGGEGFNNFPRKELAAYHAQMLFLEPFEYVVPPTLGRCVTLARHRETLGHGEPTFPDTECVFGQLAFWVVNVTPDNARDMERFKTDEAYRDSLAALNLLTYVVDHRDPRDANFLVSKDPDRPRLFSIDNGLSFGGFTNPFTPLIGDWGDLQVSAISARHVDKLRTVTQEQIDALAVVAQFENRDGVLEAVEPTAPLNEDEGVSYVDGVAQFGLTRGEIDDLGERIEKLIERVDAGEVTTF